MSEAEGAAKLRLLVCYDCKTIEELPDYQGPPEGDDLLEVLASRHVFPDDARSRHFGRIFDVPEKEWQTPNIRREIIEQIKKRSADGLGTDFYAVKDTLKEDAMTCWKQHNRTRDCGDFKADSKRLAPDTKAERKELGLAPMKSNHFLCEFCPMHAIAMQRMRAKRGDYDYTD